MYPHVCVCSQLCRHINICMRMCVEIRSPLWMLFFRCDPLCALRQSFRVT